MIESISLKNFKAFKEVEMKDIPPFCVIVGANGTGKSTIFNVLGFLRDAMALKAAVPTTGESIAILPASPPTPAASLSRVSPVGWISARVGNRCGSRAPRMIA